MASTPTEPAQTTDISSLCIGDGPNETTNRVPTELELEGLRTLAASTSHIANFLDGEIEKLQTSHKALLDRLLQQQRELEATRSQLRVTKKLIDSLQDQRSTVKIQMEELCGLMHPVRRLPVELLRAIFEATAEVTDSKLTAVRLSHVCRLWRVIALDAPQLWSQVMITPFANSDSFWANIIPRMKKVPASINVDDIKADHVPLLQKWRLWTIPNLEKLTLCASYVTGPQSVCQKLFEQPYVPLKELTFVLHDSVGIEEYVAEDIQMGQFPSLLKLIIRGMGHLCFGFSSSPTLTTLILDEVDVDIETIPPLLQLETLKLRCVEFNRPGSQEGLVFPNLRLLQLVDTSLFEEPWAAALRFPRLHSLYNDNGPTDLFAAFVMSHPGIKELDCFIDGQVAAYAAALPAITSFSLVSQVGSPVNEFINWMEAGMSTAPFPSLKVLTLSGDITLAEFEEVVCARCLPLDHPRSRIEPSMLPVEELRVILDSEVWEEAAWAQNELARSASVEVIPYIPEEELYCAALRW